MGGASKDRGMGSHYPAHFSVLHQSPYISLSLLLPPSNSHTSALFLPGFFPLADSQKLVIKHCKKYFLFFKYNYSSNSVRLRHISRMEINKQRCLIGCVCIKETNLSFFAFPFSAEWVSPLLSAFCFAHVARAKAFIWGSKLVEINVVSWVFLLCEPYWNEWKSCKNPSLSYTPCSSLGDVPNGLYQLFVELIVSFGEFLCQSKNYFLHKCFLYVPKM